MKFWKMNGAGNDFILLNNLEEQLNYSIFPQLAKTLCDRRRSIGADGMMVVAAPTLGGDCKMMFYNSDGSAGEMCGNGARCICRYAYETGLAGETQIIETMAGTIIGHRIDRQNFKIRLNDPTTVLLNQSVDVDGEQISYAYLELGSPGLPHAVVAMDHLKETDMTQLRQLGKKLRWHEKFPKGANVNFYEILGEDHLYERTYERGVEDFTYACGTGTGCLVAALTLLGKVSGRNVRVDMDGGTLTVDVDMVEGDIRNLYLTGPTNMVCLGQVTDDTLSLLRS